MGGAHPVENAHRMGRMRRGLSLVAWWRLHSPVENGFATAVLKGRLPKLDTADTGESISGDELPEAVRYDVGWSVCVVLLFNGCMGVKPLCPLQCNFGTRNLQIFLYIFLVGMFMSTSYYLRHFGLCCGSASREFSSGASPHFIVAGAVGRGCLWPFQYDIYINNKFTAACHCSGWILHVWVVPECVIIIISWLQVWAVGDLGYHGFSSPGFHGNKRT